MGPVRTVQTATRGQTTTATGQATGPLFRDVGLTSINADAILASWSVFGDQKFAILGDGRIQLATAATNPANAQNGQVWYDGTSILARLGGANVLLGDPTLGGLAAVVSTVGGLIVGTGLNTFTNLALGPTGQILVAGATSPEWSGTGLTFASGVMTIAGSAPGTPGAGQVLIGGGAIKARGNIQSETGSFLLPTGGAIYAGGNLAAAFYSTTPGAPGAAEVFIGGGQIKAGAGITCPIMTTTVGFQFGAIPVGTNWNEQLLITTTGSTRPKMTLAASGGYRWSICVSDPAGTAGLAFRYEEGALDALQIARTGAATFAAGIACTTLTASASMISVGANTVTQASQVVVDFLSGARIQSYGADSSTYGTITFLQRTSTGTARTAAVIDAAGALIIGTDPDSGSSALLRLGGASLFGGDVSLLNTSYSSVSIKVGSNNVIRLREFGYTGYGAVQVGNPNNSVALGVDVNAIAGGSFQGNNTNVIVARSTIILQANAGGTDFERATLLFGNATLTGSLTVGAAEYTYFGDSATDGSWRIGRSSNDLVIQRRESATWVTKQTVAA